MTAEKPQLAEDGQAGFPASETLKNQGLQEPESGLSGKHQELSFEQINEVTWKLTDGRGTNAWDGYRGGYRTTRAVAWLIGVGSGLWVVRYRDKSSKPKKLPNAKAYALEMVKGIRPGKVITHTIGRLHRLHLDVHEPMPEMAQVWAIETADYPALYSRPSGPSEIPRGDDCPLEYYGDGYPMLPDYLRR